MRCYQARRLTGCNYILKSLHFICMREGGRKGGWPGGGSGEREEGGREEGTKTEMVALSEWKSQG